jgi:hypothetical protein
MLLQAILTFSVLRGGINQFTAGAYPSAWEGAAVIQVIAERAEGGSHLLQFVCMDQDGTVLAKLEMNFDVPDAGRTINLVISRFAIPIPKAGDYSVRVSVDRHCFDDVPFKALLAGPPEAPAGEGRLGTEGE